MEPTYEIRCAEALRLLAQKDVRGWKTVPTLYRFLWSNGLKVRPPHFASWETNFFLRGGCFGAILGASSWIVSLITGNGELVLVRAAAIALAAGVIHGFARAARYKREAEEHELPSWDELSGTADVFD